MCRLLLSDGGLGYGRCFRYVLDIADSLGKLDGVGGVQLAQRLVDGIRLGLDRGHQVTGVQRQTAIAANLCVRAARRRDDPLAILGLHDLTPLALFPRLLDHLRLGLVIGCELAEVGDVLDGLALVASGECLSHTVPVLGQAHVPFATGVDVLVHALDVLQQVLGDPGCGEGTQVGPLSCSEAVVDVVG